MDSWENFDEIADTICADSKDYTNVFYECFEDGELLSLADFYKTKNEWQKSIADKEKNDNEASDSEADDDDDDTKLDLFERFVAEAMKALGDFIAISEMSKKSMSPMENDNGKLSMNASSSSSSSESSELLLDLSQLDGKTLPSLADVFTDFRKFGKQLQQIKTIFNEIADNEPEYIENLQELKSISMELNMIFPEHYHPATASNAKQEDSLLRISKEFEVINFTDFHLPQNLQSNTFPHLDDIRSVLSLCIEALNTANAN